MMRNHPDTRWLATDQALSWHQGGVAVFSDMALGLMPGISLMAGPLDGELLLAGALAPEGWVAGFWLRRGGVAPNVKTQTLPIPHTNNAKRRLVAGLRSAQHNSAPEERYNLAHGVSRGVRALTPSPVPLSHPTCGPGPRGGGPGRRGVPKAA